MMKMSSSPSAIKWTRYHWRWAQHSGGGRGAVLVRGGGRELEAEEEVRYQLEVVEEG